MGCDVLFPAELYILKSKGREREREMFIDFYPNVLGGKCPLNFVLSKNAV